MNKRSDDKMFWIAGTKVYFPLQPYSTQISIMNHVLESIKKSKNCLIESPTGTGKTLALLCSALSWLEEKKSIFYKFLEKNKQCECNKKVKVKNQENYTIEKQELSSEYFNDADDDFIDLNKKLDSKPKPEKIVDLSKDICECAPTRIFYCTRTHKQISQVISELKRTKYANGLMKMTILSSRKISCLNDEARNSLSLTDTCRELTKKRLDFREKCPYFQNIGSTDTHKKLIIRGMSPVWTQDEFIDFSIDSKTCAYFTSQKLAEQADIIFAPYNYVLNPLISDQLSLNIKNSIIILDEAHNIEDICRSSMSAVFTVSLLLSCFTELNQLSGGIYGGEKYVNLKQAYFTISALISSFSNWAKSNETNLEFKSVTVRERIFTGNEFKLSIEEYLKIDSTAFQGILASYKKIINSFSDEDFDGFPRPSDFSQQIMSSVILVLEYIIIKSPDNFVISISKGNHNDLEGDSLSLLNNPKNNAKHNPKIQQSSTIDNMTISFNCLTPSIAFNLATTECRTVILASGTLSPITSFSPELKSPFDITFQTSNHLQRGQAAIVSLTVDSKNSPLRLTYQNIDSLKHQDEIGTIILSICELVPHGVLCFFPSYTVMEKLLKRWEITSFIEKISNAKATFVERRGMKASEVDEMLLEYNNASCYSKPGSLLLAVCRGRISEGIDFPDNRARAVIALGIPYSNIKVLDIERKMKFNDENKANEAGSALLSGREWYNIQAYRALNQALGRCIRHRNDWGAIILIDERFGTSETYTTTSQNYLSPWIRKSLKSYSNFNNFLQSLQEFFDSKKIISENNDANGSLDKENSALNSSSLIKGNKFQLTRKYFNAKKSSTLGWKRAKR